MADDPMQWSEERKRVASFGRLEDGLLEASPWYLWGPYLSERAWGTVREDYSGEDVEAWDYLSHDIARSRAYRWSEDGLAGFCDIEQRLCLALVLWNGQDPILKERLYGVAGPEGNHGEDAKEYWWFVDSLPSHVWNQWRYHYPQGRFPYDELAAGHGTDHSKPELELLDTKVFDDDRYWVVEVDYAKDSPDDVLMRIRITNVGPQAERLHVLPTLWFRNVWSWDRSAPPSLRATGSRTVAADHPTLGALEWLAGPGPDGTEPRGLFCENETNAPRCFGAPATTPFPKDGIHDHVLSLGDKATVNPDQVGTKAAFWYRVDVDPGATAELRLRLRPANGPGEGDPDSAVREAFTEVMERRRAEADAFYEELTPKQTPPEDAVILRQAVAGMLWCKQFYNYDVERWLEGDPAFPPPPESRKRPGARNVRWRHLRAFDVMSMPDSWEYPWFAAWDTAFHCLALAHVDPAFAKYQLATLCREGFQHQDGAIPAYEWNFDDVNPPVQAWGALQVFHIDGDRDVDFLRRIYSKLLLNFTWWTERLDAEGNNLFEGGFLGLDNIGPIDRSNFARDFPPGTTLEQSDASGWMAFYSLQMLHIATTLALRGALPPQEGEELVVRFLDHFHDIASALNLTGVWDDADGFYYDQLRLPGGRVEPLRVRSMVGIIPLLAAAVVDERAVEQTESLDRAFDRMERGGLVDVQGLRRSGYLVGDQGSRRLLLAVASEEKLRRLFRRMFDPEAFLSPYGLRSLSKEHRDRPFTLHVGDRRFTVGYEPAESLSGMFGGNSNWRGPVWFPLNHLVISALERYHSFFGDEFTIEYPTGSGATHTLSEVARDLRERLISLFRVGPDGRRPAYGFVDKLQRDPRWNRHPMFFEYFQADDGAGLGASHQTGWTGLVVDMIRRRPDREPLDPPAPVASPPG